MSVSFKTSKSSNGLESSNGNGLDKIIDQAERAKRLYAAVDAAGLTVFTVDDGLSLAVSDGSVTARFADNWASIWQDYLDGSPHIALSSLVQTLLIHIDHAHKWHELLVRPTTAPADDWMPGTEYSAEIFPDEVPHDC